MAVSLKNYVRFVWDQPKVHHISARHDNTEACRFMGKELRESHLVASSGRRRVSMQFLTYKFTHLITSIKGFYKRNAQLQYC